MSDEELDNNLKSNLLLKEFGEYGYEKTNRISKSELILFLNLKSPNGKFDSILSEKLFNILSLNASKTISIEQSVLGIIKLEEEYKKNVDIINSEYLKEKEIYNKLLEQCEKYKFEKLNEEGFSDGGKLYGEIIDMNLKAKLDGIQEIIIKIIYANQEKEIKQNSANIIENEKNILNAPFEFKANSKKDNLEFILQGKNESENIFNFGSKVYSLLEIDTNDEFLLKIEIADKDGHQNENENELKIIAEINAKIVMQGAYFPYYDLKRKEEEVKLNKLLKDLEEEEEILKKIKNIYNDKDKGKKLNSSIKKMIQNKKIINNSPNNTLIRSSYIFENNFKSDKPVDKNIKNNKLYEFPINKIAVQFNNVRIDGIINKGLSVIFNNQYYVTMKENINNKNDENQNDEKYKDKKELIMENNNEKNISKVENENNEEKKEDTENLEKKQNLEENEENSQKQNNQNEQNEQKNQNEENEQNKQNENEENVQNELKQKELEQNEENNEDNIKDLEDEPKDENELKDESEYPMDGNEIRDENELKDTNDIKEESEMKEESEIKDENEIKDTNEIKDESEIKDEIESNNDYPKNKDENNNIKSNVHEIKESINSENQNQIINKSQNNNVRIRKKIIKKIIKKKKKKINKSQTMNNNNINQTTYIGKNKISKSLYLPQNVQIQQRQINNNQNINFNSGAGNKKIKKQNYPNIQRPTILNQQTILPLQYLPDKINPIIFSNTVKPLSLNQMNNNISHSTIQNNYNINKFLGIPQYNTYSYNNPIMSYQGPIYRNNNA